MVTEAKVFIIGGAEDRGACREHTTDASEGILERIVNESKYGKSSRIEIITAASSVPIDLGNEYLKAFAELKATNVDALHVTNREEAASKDVLNRLAAADVVFFTGGDQLRLTSVLGGTEFYNILMERLQDPDFIYAGTSAGAAVTSATMITSGQSENAIYKGEIRTSSGFGILTDLFIDTHFIQRGRVGRLFQALVSNPNIIGVGLEENTALLINKGTMEAMGSGVVLVADGRKIKNSNLLDIRDGSPISIENIVVHVMSLGDVYNLESHRLNIVTAEENLL